jgi:polyhydroxybutyrate depolymerase
VAAADAPDAPSTVSAAPARPSAGCSGTAPVASGATTQTMTLGASQRTYRRYVPPGPGSQPLPAVINLHGLTSNIDQQVVVTGFEVLAEQEKFVVLTPQALGAPTQWSTAMTPDNPDVAFLGSMLDEVAAATCIDLARVYATGLSDGGIMSSILACRMGDRIAAVGLVAGITHPAGCSPGRAMPAIVFWGKQDVVLPYCGGLGPAVVALLRGDPVDPSAEPACPPQSIVGFPPVEDVVRTWVSEDGCDPTPRIVDAGAGVEERLFGGCRDGAIVRFYVVADGGHSWPGSKAMEAFAAFPAGRIIGHTTMAVDATRLIWAFFRGHALSPQ